MITNLSKNLIHQYLITKYCINFYFLYFFYYSNVITANTNIISIVFCMISVGGDSTQRYVLVSHGCWAGGQSYVCFDDGP